MTSIFRLINLKSRSDRLAQMYVKLKESEFPLELVERFEAVPGHKLDVEVLKKILSSSAYEDIHRERTRHGQLTKGAVGCYLSHTQIWKELVDAPSNIKYAVIMEDDIKIPKKFFKFMNAVLDKLSKTNTHFDMFLFSSFCPRGLSIIKCMEDIPSHTGDVKIKKFNVFWSMAFYVITKEAASKLLQGAFPMADQIDTYISKKMLKNEFTVLGTYPSIINQDYENNGTNIQTPCPNCNINEELKPFIHLA